MLVALHIDANDWARLLGLWVAPSGSAGFPECFYPESGVGPEVGRGRMEVKGPKVPWSAFFWRLQHSSPHSAYWSVREVPDGASLPELFEQLAIEVVESAESLAATTPPAGFSMVVPAVTDASPSPDALSAAIGGPIAKLKTKHKLSTRCQFFADEDQLVVIARADIAAKDADLALAWGLAYRGDRQLSVVLPEQVAWPTRVRVPWLVPSVRVFAHDGHVVHEPLPLTHDESIAAFAGRTWEIDRPAVLGDKADWVEAVLGWTTIAPGINKIERPSYVSWHIAGRQVLKMIPTGKRLNVTAGVDSTKAEKWPVPEKLVLIGVASAEQSHAVIAAASVAAAQRLAAVDTANREHQMQAALDPSQLNLAAGWRREFPAWRPGSSRAYIDFLAKDHHDRLHVVETKIGADAMLALQGLDYWLWCRANTAHANAALDAAAVRSPVIDFVVGPTRPNGEPISIYTAAQVEALHRYIEWRFTVVDDPDPAQGIHQLPPYRIPNKHRRVDDLPPRWATRLHQHALDSAAAASAPLFRTHSFTNIEDAIVASAFDAHQQLATAGRLHDYVRHVRSSQAFALNLLAPLTLDAWTAIARHHLHDPSASVLEPAIFEYTDPLDSLREATAASPHATQVDCLIHAVLGDGRKHALMIEVKLSEDNFSTCSAYASPRNNRRHICAQPGPFGSDPAACFQLANHDREHRRRYDIALGQAVNAPVSFGCWFRDGANQVMRNAALVCCQVVPL